MVARGPAHYLPDKYLLLLVLCAGSRTLTAQDRDPVYRPFPPSLSGSIRLAKQPTINPPTKERTRINSATSVVDSHSNPGSLMLNPALARVMMVDVDVATEWQLYSLVAIGLGGAAGNASFIFLS